MKYTICAMALLLSSQALAAVEDEGFHGYLRAGVGVSSAGGPQSCFGFGGVTAKYRLGNECDSFTKFGYTKELAEVDGVQFVGTLWVSAWNAQSDFDGAKTGINKAYVEARNLPFLNGGSAWIGNRDYLWSDIHMMDLWYINLNGSSTGGGLEGIPMGPGRFSYAVFKDNDTNVRHPTEARVLDSSAAIRQNVIYQGLPVIGGGSVDVILTSVHAQGGADRHDGWQASLFHKQPNVAGGVNTVALQYGVGPGTGVGRGPNDGYNRVDPSGSTSLGRDVTQLRIFDHLWIQPTRNFGLSFVALAQRDKSAARGSSTWLSIGVRPVFGITNYFKMQFELGADRISDPDGGPAKRLTKLTIAPTISAGPGVWARPELRAFVTYGKWNDAATATINAANNGGPVYGRRTSGASAGIQVETWF